MTDKEKSLTQVIEEIVGYAHPDWMIAPKEHVIDIARKLGLSPADIGLDLEEKDDQDT